MDAGPAGESDVVTARPHVACATAAVGDIWRDSPYYDMAEPYMEGSWADQIWPYIEGCDFSSVVDLAAGHGRNSAMLLPLCESLWIVDIHQENLDFCRERFGRDPRITYVLGDGMTLEELPSDGISLVYCFDAMVHFDSDTIRSYLAEFRRVLRPGGRGFCHHSNHTGNPGGDWLANPHWRNFMSRELFAHYAHKEGLRMLRSDPVDWGEGPNRVSNLDCFSLFERSAGGCGKAGRIA
jgi:SAM-dependent methyltransferase